MNLTDKQLDAIKAKIEADKIFPMKAIKELHPEDDAKELRKQLFAKYDKKELRSFAKLAKEDN